MMPFIRHPGAQPCLIHFPAGKRSFAELDNSRKIGTIVLTSHLILRHATLRESTARPDMRSPFFPDPPPGISLPADDTS